MEQTCTWKIHLVDGSFRNIKIPVSATSKDAIESIVPRLRTAISPVRYKSAFALRYVAVRETGWLLPDDVLDTKLRDSLVGSRLELRIRVWPKNYENWAKQDWTSFEYAYEQLVSEFRDERYSDKPKAQNVVAEKQETELYLSCLSLRIFMLKAQSNAYASYELNESNVSQSNAKAKQRTATGLNERFTLDGLDDEVLEKFLGEALIEFSRRTQKGKKALKRISKQMDTMVASVTSTSKSCLVAIGALICEFMKVLERESRFDLERFSCILHPDSSWTLPIQLFISPSDEVSFLFENTLRSAQLQRFELIESVHLAADNTDNAARKWSVKLKRVGTGEMTILVFQKQADAANVASLARAYAKLPDFGERDVPLVVISDQPQSTTAAQTQPTAPTPTPTVASSGSQQRPKPPPPPVRSSSNSHLANAGASSSDLLAVIKAKANAAQKSTPVSAPVAVAGLPNRTHSASSQSVASLSSTSNISSSNSKLSTISNSTAINTATSTSNANTATTTASDSYTEALNALASLASITDALQPSAPSASSNANAFRSPRTDSAYSSTATVSTSTPTPAPTPKPAPVAPPTQFVRGGELDRNAIDLLGLLGSGQYGEVYKGRLRGIIWQSDTEGDTDAESAQLVAVKICKADESPADRRSTVETCLQEAFIMRQFDHPHIIRLIGVCSTVRPVWLVMEFAPFGELRSYLESRRASIRLRTLLTFVRQIAQALAYLESRKFVHRDVAARNVLVSGVTPGRECVKLADFGLARWLADDEGGLYVASAGKLPIRWLAPESVNYRRFSAASDVWMFAVCAWEVFAFGAKPFAGVSNAQVVLCIERGERLAQPEHCPPHVYALLRECWLYDPDRRPSFTAIVTRLSSLLDALDDETGTINSTTASDGLPAAPPPKPAHPAHCASLDALDHADSSPSTSSNCVDIEQTQTSAMPPKPKPPPLSFSLERLLQDSTRARGTSNPVAADEMPQYRLSVVSADVLLPHRARAPAVPGSSGSLVGLFPATRPPLPPASPNRSNASLDSTNNSAAGRLRQVSADCYPSARKDSLASASSSGYSRFDSFGTTADEPLQIELEAEAGAGTVPVLLPPPAAFADKDGTGPLSPGGLTESLQDSKWLEEAERAFDPLSQSPSATTALNASTMSIASMPAVPGFVDDELHTATVRLVQKVFEFCRKLHETSADQFRAVVLQIGVDLRAMLAIADQSWSVLSGCVTIGSAAHERVPSQRQRVVRDLEALIGTTKLAQQYVAAVASATVNGISVEQLRAEMKKHAHQLAIDAKQLYDELRDARDSCKRVA